MVQNGSKTPQNEARRGGGGAPPPPPHLYTPPPPFPRAKMAAVPPEREMATPSIAPLPWRPASIPWLPWKRRAAPPPTARARCHGAALWLPWQPGAFGTTAPVAIETPSIPRLPWRPPSIAWLLWRPRTPPGCYGDPPSVAMETPLLRVPPESPEHPPVAMVTPGTTAPVAMETPITPPPLYPLPWRQPAWCAPPPPTSVATATAALLPR